MTRKENLRKEIRELAKNYEELTAAKYCGNYKFRRFEEKSTTIADLEEVLNDLHDAIDDYKFNKMVVAFWGTEEGAKMKKELEAEEARISNRINELLNRRQNEFTKAIQSILDRSWECVSAGDRYIRFERMRNGERIFGSDIEVTAYTRFQEEVRLEFNVGTMGSFKLDSDRAIFYKDFAKLLENVNEVSILEMLAWYHGLLKNEQKDLEAVEAKLKNPFIAA